MARQTKTVNTYATVTYDDLYNNRWLDAVGENVRKFELGLGIPTDDTTGDPTQFTCTMTEAGAGNTTAVNNTEAGQAVLITNAANENDGINMQLKGSAFQLTAGKPLYFGIKCKISDATQSDLLVGLCEVDTTLINAHAHAVTDDGIYFSCLDGSTTINFTNELNGTEGTTASSVAMDTNEHIYEIYYDGQTVYAYVDNNLVTSVSAGLAAVALTPSVAFYNGEAVAKNMDIAWMRCIQVR